MLKRILLIDDFRIMDDATDIVRNGEDGINFLQHHGPWDKLYLDHDLGDGISGYDVITWLEKNPWALPKETICISANPIGRERINMIIQKLYGHVGGYYAHSTAIIDEDVKIGAGTKVWHHTHISTGARIGKGCSIGQGVYIGENVIIGDGCKIQNNVNIYSGVTVGNKVFFGPNSTTTNDNYPRAFVNIDLDDYCKTIIKDEASIGAGAVLVCKNNEPLIIGAGAMVGAGAVVTKDVPSGKVVVGNPAREV